jgi:TonB family protein
VRISLGCLVLAAALGADDSQPARLSESPTALAIPPLPGQCQAAFDVGVDSRGLVTDVRLLYGDTALTNALETTIAGWAFEPARRHGVRRASRVLVAALCRAAALYRIGPCPTPDVTALVPPEVPIPVAVSPPAYPVRAPGGGAVIVEVEIGSSGHVRSAQAVGKQTAFDGAAEQAARAWRFLPGGQQSRSLPTVAYLVLVFPEPARVAGPE